jgi:sugar/nucleoside kinase (ribokinase family)
VRDVVLTLDAFPPQDGKVAARTLVETTGGPVPNALVTLSRLGRRASFGGVVGSDPAGERVRAELLMEGVDAVALVEIPALSTPTSVILVVGDARSVVECGQIDLPDTDLPLDHWLERAESASWFLADGRLPAAQLRLAERVRERGGRVMLDGGTPRPGLEALIPLADVAVFSSSYALRSGVDDQEIALTRFSHGLAARLPAEGLGVAGLTLGARGSLLVTREGRTLRHFPPCIEAVDTTGAGDVFHGALAGALIGGAELESAARFANAAAALSCEGLTGRGPLPSRDEILRRAEELGRGSSRDT